jgi:hypothetical protein
MCINFRMNGLSFAREAKEMSRRPPARSETLAANAMDGGVARALSKEIDGDAEQLGTILFLVAGHVALQP